MQPAPDLDARQDRVLNPPSEKKIVSSLQPGSRLGPYEIRSPLGRGGMGEVYRAFDPRLEREIAIKVLPPEVANDQDRLARFEREAKALAAVRHPGVVTVFSVEESDGLHFLTMELVEGRTLGHEIVAGGMSLERFLPLATQLARALAAAHERGIVHRDLKPGNIMVDDAGGATLLDFGLVKRVAAADSDAEPTLSLEEKTAVGAVLGTWHYMSPEQARGEEVDARSDVFSLGAVFYEMLTGRRPFEMPSQAETVASILHRRETPLSELRPDLPAALSGIVERCLEKSPRDRYASGAELGAALGALLPASGSGFDSAVPAVGGGSPQALRVVAPLLLALLLVVAAVASWLWSRSVRERWVREEAVPRIERLIEARQITQAFALAQEAVRRAPGSEDARRLAREASFDIDLDSEPSGAEVSYRDYDDLDAEWVSLGETPLEKIPLPRDTILLRLEKDGYLPLEGQFDPVLASRFGKLELTPVDGAPREMVWIGPGQVALWSNEAVRLDGYWLDRFEVTNEAYQAFVDAGGYRESRYWRHPFVEDGRELAFEEAMARFVDRTGQSGPATWELGAFPAGEERHPVRGVSWYEAAAYAEFIGKALPTIYHWRNGAPPSPFDALVRMGNLEGEAVGEVGSFQAISIRGVHDLPGNVAEWVHNAVNGKRYVLGSAWRDPAYSFANDLAHPPMAREETFGFRCALYPEEPSPELLAPIEINRVDFGEVTAVSDEVFEVYRSLYRYDPTPLDARVEEVDESSPYWRYEKVSFAAAYRDERIVGHLFLPARARPPYQAVVFFPSSGARSAATSDQLTDLHFVDFVPRSGRAFFYPVYQGTYERRGEGRPDAPAALRRQWVEMVQDLGRSVDYLLSRDDVDGSRLAYMGLSLGSEYAPIMTAIETRFRASVLLAGGFDDQHMLDEPAEINPWNFAPRVRVPTLMINGDLDFGLPIETGQRPMFEMLGVPDEDKRHVVLSGGHMPNDQNAIVRETLEWLDRYLGPVELRSPAEVGSRGASAD